MALNLKTLVIGSAVGGGCIGVPVCLFQSGGQGSSAVASSTTPVQVASATSTPVQTFAETKHGTFEVAKSVEKVSCEISNDSDISKDFESFLKSPINDIGLYNLVSCNNASEKENYDSFFGKNWKGLFPKNVLSEKLLIKTGEKFGINVENILEEGSISGTQSFTVFSNSQVSSASVRGTISDISDEKSSKKMVTVSLEGIRQAPKEVYLLVASQNSSTGETQ